jgi:hypothetical protein
VYIGDFVEVQAFNEVQENGKLFWIAKIQELRNVAIIDREFLALWYWLTTPKDLQDGPDAMQLSYYVDCLTQTWEPNRTYKGCN